jgi:hypothetical protein
MSSILSSQKKKKAVPPEVLANDVACATLQDLLGWRRVEEFSAEDCAALCIQEGYVPPHVVTRTAVLTRLVAFDEFRACSFAPRVKRRCRMAFLSVFARASTVASKKPIAFLDALALSRVLAFCGGVVTYRERRARSYRVEAGSSPLLGRKATC